FYEWRKTAAGKQPYYIRSHDGAPLAFAGLWERWPGPDGAPVETCTILTTEPNELMAPLHNRMPVILPRDAYATWLDPKTDDASRLQPLLGPCPSESLRADPVSKRVNNPANDTPECINPQI
ncbi:MAG: SOS response-associated peptidase, partial [Phycisphaerae bacterium]